jgi:endonuclease/exonuclease/phosphatase family metal-dependent hydrolase
MKLIQLNVWQGFVSKKTIELVHYEEPDIMCAQEVMSSDIRIPHFSNTTIHQQLLTIFPHHYFFKTHNYIAEGHTVQYGGVTYSKMPIIASDHTFTLSTSIM